MGSGGLQSPSMEPQSPQGTPEPLHRAPGKSKAPPGAPETLPGNPTAPQGTPKSPPWSPRAAQGTPKVHPPPEPQTPPHSPAHPPPQGWGSGRPPGWGSPVGSGVSQGSGVLKKCCRSRDTRSASNCSHWGGKAVWFGEEPPPPGGPQTHGGGPSPIEGVPGVLYPRDAPSLWGCPLPGMVWGGPYGGGGGVHGVPTSRARRSAASVKVRRSRVRAPCSRRSRRHSCSSPGVGGLGAASTAAIASCTTGIREGARGRPGTPRQRGGIPESPPQPHYLQAAVLQGDHLPPGCRLLPQPLQLLLQVGVPSGGRGVLGGVGGVLGAPVGSLLPAGEG